MSLRISAVQPHVDQQALFTDRHAITSPAAVRTLVGAYFEEATRKLFGAERHQIDSTADVCPDFSVAGRARSFLEVKSVGRGRQALIYSKRLENDRRLMRSGAALTYVFWIHDVEATRYTSREALYAALAAGVDRVLVIPAGRILAACRKLTPRVMNYRTPRKGRPAEDGEPMPGYRLSWSTLRRLAAGKAVVERTVSGVRGTDLRLVHVHGAVARAYAPISAAERAMAGELLAELGHSRLEVELRPAPRSTHAQHCIRVVTNRNPPWYRRLCEATPNARKRPRCRRASDTGIKRHQVERALERLGGGICQYPYDWLLLPIVRRFAAAMEAA
jgi:hypothetical protein